MVVCNNGGTRQILITILIIIINVYRHENAIRKGPHPLYLTEQCFERFPVVKMTSGYVVDLLISIGPSWRQLLIMLIHSSPLMTTPGLYLHHVKGGGSRPS